MELIPDYKDVRKLMDEKQISIFEAKSELIKKNARILVDNASSIEDLKPILNLLVDNIHRFN